MKKSQKTLKKQRRIRAAKEKQKLALKEAAKMRKDEEAELKREAKNQTFAQKRAHQNARTVLSKSDKAVSAMQVTRASPYFVRLPTEVTTPFSESLQAIEKMRAAAVKCIEDEEAKNYELCDFREVEKLCTAGLKAEALLAALMRGIAVMRQ